MRFKDKIVLITGSSRGVGRATALAFAKEGAIVVVNYISNEEKANSLVKEISEKINLVFPCHPRTRNNMGKFGITLPESVLMLGPLPYMELLNLNYSTFIGAYRPPTP